DGAHDLVSVTNVLGVLALEPEWKVEYVKVRLLHRDQLLVMQRVSGFIAHEQRFDRCPSPDDDCGAGSGERGQDYVLEIVRADKLAVPPYAVAACLEIIGQNLGKCAILSSI